jgi:periplasmic divalent cation tolerance protein
MSDFCLIYVTTASADQAKGIARALLDQRLVACANILDGATSLYWWDGAIQEDAETVLIMKTRRDLADPVKDKVLELHDYACPCVVVVPIADGNPAFLDWIAQQTVSP